MLLLRHASSLLQAQKAYFREDHFSGGRPLAIIKHENGQQPYTDAEIDAGLVLAGVEPPQRPLAKTRTVQGGQVAAGATVLGLTAEAVRQVEPAIPLLQSLLQVAPWVVGAAALTGIAYMIWARIDDRRRGLR